MNAPTDFFRILYRCPAGERLTDCPIYEKDFLSLKNKFQWFTELLKERKDAIMNYHIECSKKSHRKKNTG